MKHEPAIAIVGAGNLGTAMASALVGAGYRVTEIVHRGGASGRRAKDLAKRMGARAVKLGSATLDAGIVWLCVGDSAIARCAAELAKCGTWKGKTAFHASGALASSELNALKQLGAVVASVHPMMTFVRGVRPELKDVIFATEGDARAVRQAQDIARALGSRSVPIVAANKPMYHAFGAFTSPLIIATISAAEQVARKAGLSSEAARAAIGPILQQTVRNYLEHGAAAAFSGPLVRGDVETVRRHLNVLRAAPEARAAYVALARIALKKLPGKNKAAIKKLLRAE